MKKQGAKGLLVACIVCAVLAIGGCVFAIAQINTIAKKDQAIITLREKIDKDGISDCVTTEQLMAMLTGEDALNMLQNSAKDLGLDFKIISANVVGENKETNARWVTYVRQNSDDSLERYYIIFNGDGGGNWQFELPGFTEYTPQKSEGFKFDFGL